MKNFALIALMALGSVGILAQARAFEDCVQEGCQQGCQEGCQQGCCHGCSNCGCHKFRKQCRLVCEMRKEVSFVYEMECEDLCLLAPSKCCGHKTVCDCQALKGYRHEQIQKPCGCNYSRVVRKPYKIAVIKEKPAYKCVMERICCGCGGCCGAQPATDVQASAVQRQVEAQGILPVSAEQEVVVPVEEAAVASDTPAPSTAKKSGGPFGLFRLISQ